LSIVSTSPLFSKLFRNLSRRSSPWNRLWNFLCIIFSGRKLFKIKF
jgi:hypothetical protein